MLTIKEIINASNNPSSKHSPGTLQSTARAALTVRSNYTPQPNPEAGRVAITWVKGIPPGLYQALRTGQIWSCEGECFLTPEDKHYQEVGLKFEGFRHKVLVHRLICHAFYGPPPTPKHQANHINGDTHDNSALNLEWTTQSENIIHRNEVLKSDKGGGTASFHVKCPHCQKWLSLHPEKGRTQ